MLFVPAFLAFLAATAFAAPALSKHRGNSALANYDEARTTPSVTELLYSRSYDADTIVYVFARSKKDNSPTLHSWTLPSGGTARLTEKGHRHIINRDDTHRTTGDHPHIPDHLRNNIGHVLQHATTHGTVVAHQNPGHEGGHPRPIYKFTHGGQEHHMAISVHEDGRVLGANMSSASAAAHWNSVAHGHGH